MEMAVVCFEEVAALFLEGKGRGLTLGLTYGAEQHINICVYVHLHDILSIQIPFALETI